MKISKESEYYIHCSKCSASENIYSGDSEYRCNDTPTRYFKRQGWRDTKTGDNLCPECAEIYKKFTK